MKQIKAESRKGISTKALMKPSARDVDSAVRKIGGDTEEPTVLPILQCYYHLDPRSKERKSRRIHFWV